MASGRNPNTNNQAEVAGGTAIDGARFDASGVIWCARCGDEFGRQPLSQFYALLFEDDAQQKRLVWIATNDPNAAHTCDGAMALHFVVGLTGPQLATEKSPCLTGQKALEMARLLLDRGANMNAVLNFSCAETPLIQVLKAKKYSRRYYSVEEQYLMCKLLLERGASSVTAFGGETPLHLCYKFGAPLAVVQLFLSAATIRGRDGSRIAACLLAAGPGVDRSVYLHSLKFELDTFGDLLVNDADKDERVLSGQMDRTTYHQVATIEKLRLIFDAYGVSALDGSSGTKPVLLSYVKRSYSTFFCDCCHVTQHHSPPILEFLLGEIGLSPFLNTDRVPTLSCKLICDSIQDPDCFSVVMKHVKPADVEKFNNQALTVGDDNEETCNMFTRCLEKYNTRLPQMSKLVEIGFSPDHPRFVKIEHWLANFAFIKKSPYFMLEMLKSLTGFNAFSPIGFAFLRFEHNDLLKQTVQILIERKPSVIHSNSGRETTTLGTPVIKLPTLLAFIIRLTFRHSNNDTEIFVSTIYEMLKRNGRYGARSPTSVFHSPDVVIAAAGFGWPAILSDALAASCCEPLKVLSDLELFFPSTARRRRIYPTLRQIFGFAVLVLNQFTVTSSRYKANCHLLHKALGGEKPCPCQPRVAGQPIGSWAEVFDDFSATRSLKHMCRVKIRECISVSSGGREHSEMRSKIQQLPLLSFKLNPDTEGSGDEMLPDIMQNYLMYDPQADTDHAALVSRVETAIKAVAGEIRYDNILRCGEVRWNEFEDSDEDTPNEEEEEEF